MNKTLWDEFINRKAAVNCRTENQGNKLIKKLTDINSKWANNKFVKADETNWNAYKEDTCYGFNENGLQYGTASLFEHEGYKVINYKQLMKQDKSKEDKQEQFRGWQILKMIEDGKLKERDIVIWHNGARQIQEDYDVSEIGTLVNTETGKEIDVSYLSHCIAHSYFTIKPKEKHYLTFDEAIKTGKQLKHKSWNAFHSLNYALNMLAHDYEDTVRQVLSERAWEVEA